MLTQIVYCSTFKVELDGQWLHSALEARQDKSPARDAAPHRRLSAAYHCEHAGPLRVWYAAVVSHILMPVVILLGLCGPVWAACEDGRCRNYPRDPAVTHAFTLTVPCPSTGDTGHRCPGFIRDHLIPLCAGGADAVSNLWWEESARASRKDKRELQLCHRLRTIERHGDDPALRQRAMALYLQDVEAMGGDEATAVARQAF